jgi:hypothetical protein
MSARVTTATPPATAARDASDERSHRERSDQEAAYLSMPSLTGAGILDDAAIDPGIVRGRARRSLNTHNNVLL